MKRLLISLIKSLLMVGILLLPISAFTRVTPGVTGAGAGTYPSGTTYSTVSLSSLQFGMGVFIPGDGSASGQFQATLLGTSLLGLQQNIEVEGTATNGSTGTGSRTFSGTATVDMGDGTPPLVDIPFTV